MLACCKNTLSIEANSTCMWEWILNLSHYVNKIITFVFIFPDRAALYLFVPMSYVGENNVYWHLLLWHKLFV